MTPKISVFKSAESEARFIQAYDEALKLWPVPFEEKFVPTPFGDTHVIVSGPEDAPPLVLFHPAGCGSVIWHRNVGVFSRHFRTCAVDTVGEVNKSILTRPMRTRQELADWVAGLFDELGIQRAHLAGNSFGGFIAVNTALLLPERVGKIALISPAATFVQMWPWILRFFPAYMFRSTTLQKRAYDWIWQDFPREDCIAQLREITRESGTPQHLPPTVFGDAELRRLHAPALLLIGDHEVIYDPKDAIRRASRLAAGLEAGIVPDANHNAEYTAADFVNEKVVEFLTRA